MKRRLKDLRHDTASTNSHPRRRARHSPSAAERFSPANTQRASTDAAIEIMVEQVKTVLPQVSN